MRIMSMIILDFKRTLCDAGSLKQVRIMRFSKNNKKTGSAPSQGQHTDKKNANTQYPPLLSLFGGGMKNTADTDTAKQTAKKQPHSTASEDWDNDTWHTEDAWENDPWKSHMNPGDPYAPDPEPPEPEPYAFPIETTQGLIRAVPLLVSILCLLAGVLGNVMLTVAADSLRYLNYLYPIFILVLIAGIALLPAGIITVKGYLRFFQYLEVIDKRLIVPVDELLIPQIKTRQKLIRDLKRLIRDGYFQEGHLDEEAGMLYLTHAVYEESRME